MQPAEPLAPIHMPNNSIIPLVMSIGLGIAGIGIIYQIDNPLWLIVAVIGFVIFFGSMVVRSMKDDLGYYIPVEELEEEGDGSDGK